MQTAEIRRRFLDFFTANDHTLVPSASLIADDPTLLLVNAGMVPFKPYFLGEQTPPYRRAVSVQKCVRTLDIEEVGKTSRHGSFFQMCGNFSFGDYFKERAIPLAWQLLTSPVDAGGYGFDPDRLWPTVYTDDDQAADIWVRDVGVDPDRVQRRGMADNYWSMGVPGPCGPCSEIYYDRGPEHGREGGPVVDEERYLEVWNLVFMQFERGEGSGKTNFPILGPLPAPNIDTGMGLERMATLLQGVENLYEIDETYPVLAHAAALAGKRYGQSPQDDVRLRVVADHVRTGLMLIADGVIPGNEGRGYVLRRILRRVEALVGLDAFTYLATEHALLSQVATLFNVPTGEVPDRVADVVARLRAAEKELERLRADAVLQVAGSLAVGAVEVDGVAVVAAEAPAGTEAGDVRALVLDVRNRLGGARPAVVAVAARGDGRASVVVATNDHAREHGLAAGALVKELAAALGGRGGGKPDLAQGGGADPDGVPAALALVPGLVRAALGDRA